MAPNDETRPNQASDPGKDPVIREVAREEMALYSVDGRSPSDKARAGGRTAFIVLAAIGIPLVAAALAWWGGASALVMGLVYLLVFAGITFPAWYAGLMRREEETQARHIVRNEMDQNGAVPIGRR